MKQPRFCIVIPARLEGDAIVPVLDRIVESVNLPFECVVVVDDPEDPTIQVVAKETDGDPRFCVVVNKSSRIQSIHSDKLLKTITCNAFYL